MKEFEITRSAQVFKDFGTTVFLFLLGFSYSVVCTHFDVKKGCSFPKQGPADSIETFSNTLFGCASLCDRHQSCVTFEYSEDVLTDRQCRLSGKYVNDSACTAGIPQNRGKLVYELVSTV